jgi:RNA recognition motif-containing protein
MNIYIGNINYEATEEDLTSLFQQFGTVDSVKIIVDRYTNQSKGFGFIEMPNDSDAETAISSLNNTEFMGRTIKVNKARQRR